MMKTYEYQLKHSRDLEGALSVIQENDRYVTGLTLMSGPVNVANFFCGGAGIGYYKLTEDDVGRLVSALKGNKYIRDVNLEGCPIMDSGVLALCDFVVSIKRPINFMVSKKAQQVFQPELEKRRYFLKAFYVFGKLRDNGFGGGEVVPDEVKQHILQFAKPQHLSLEKAEVGLNNVRQHVKSLRL